MNLHLKLARLSAVVLLLLAASPYTAPFAVCDLSDVSHSDHAATRHLTHAGAVVRPAAKATGQPIVLSHGSLQLVPRHSRPAADRPPAGERPPLPATHLVLRL